METSAPSDDLLNQRAGPSWEHRDELGVLVALARTTRDMVRDPFGTLSGMPRDAEFIGPMLYMLIAISASVCCTFLNFTWIAFLYFFPGGELTPGALTSLLQSLLDAVSLRSPLGVLYPICAIASLLLFTAVINIYLKLRRDRLANFGATFSVICYSTGTVFLLWSIFCIAVPVAAALFTAPFVVLQSSDLWWRSVRAVFPGQIAFSIIGFIMGHFLFWGTSGEGLRAVYRLKRNVALWLMLPPCILAFIGNVILVLVLVFGK